MSKTYDSRDYGAGYAWTWFEPQDSSDDDGTGWISVEPLNLDGTLSGDEVCVIICRNYESVRRDHPDWITHKEADAQFIVDALNALEGRTP